MRADARRPRPRRQIITHPPGSSRQARRLQEERAGGQLARIEARRRARASLGRRQVGREPPLVGAAAGALEARLPLPPPGQRSDAR